MQEHQTDLTHQTQGLEPAIQKELWKALLVWIQTNCQMGLVLQIQWLEPQQELLSCELYSVPKLPFCLNEAARW